MAIGLHLTILLPLSHYLPYDPCMLKSQTIVAYLCYFDVLQQARKSVRSVQPALRVEDYVNLELDTVALHYV